MPRLSNMEWDIVAARVRGAKEERRLRTQSLGLLALVLDQFFPSLQDAFSEAVTDGPDDRGVDAIHITEQEDAAEIYKAYPVTSGCSKS